MRLAAALALALALGGTAGAGAPAGRVVRVEAPPRHAVFVPAGWFWMGIEGPNEIDALEQQCVASFQAPEDRATYVINGIPTTFCKNYRRQLEAMVQREVYVSAFEIDRDEVSVADYRACIAAGACNLDPMIAGDERYLRDAWPMVNVTWFEAQDYCRWRGGRLPTEAEWERAARGDGTCAWPWGTSAQTCVQRPADFNHGKDRPPVLRKLDHDVYLALGEPDGSEDGQVLLAPPGHYPWGEGPFGTRDQAGNVAEWTADVYSENDTSVGYLGLPAVNPRRDGGVTEARVVRGGSWRQPAFLGRADVRDPYNSLYQPDQRFAYIGFRCARTLPVR